ncbi:MAG: hypothetical protein ACJ8FS_17325 [Sphingomicrobium sp.]
MENEERLAFRIATPWFWWTIYEPGQRWTPLRICNVLVFLLLSPLIILVVIITSMLAKPAQRSADEVATYLWKEAQQTSGSRDWDDFVSIPIANPRLDEIRIEAASLPHPIRDHRDELLALVERARRLR